MSLPPILIGVRLKANPDGTLRTTNSAGDFNPVPAALNIDKPALAAALGSFVGLLTGGTAISLNLRGAWLTGTEASTCTFSIATNAGDTVGTHNWAISGSNLQQSLVVGSIGAGVFELRAIDSLGHILTLGFLSWSIAALAGGTDILAPTIPTNLKVTGGTGVLNCIIDAASDNYDNAIPPSGLDHYEVFLDGAFNKNVAAAKNPALQLTSTNIGSISSPGTPTTSQSGGIHTMNAAGTGIHNTPTEQCLFKGVAIAGDFSIIVKADAFASANPDSTSGIMIRESLAQGAIFAAVYFTTGYLQVKRRINTDGNGLNVATVNGISSGYLKLTRSGSNLIAAYSPTDKDFTDIATMALPMSSQVYTGLFLASQTAGTSVTATLREVNINTAPTVSFSVTTTGSHTVRVRALDVLGNASLQCTGVTGTAGAAASQGRLRQYGGNYLYSDRNASTDLKIARLQSWADADTNNIGTQDIIFMGRMENPDVPGDYSGNWDSKNDSGFKYLDRMLAAHRAVRPSKPLRYQLQVSPYGFAGNNKSSTTWPAGFAPKYLSGGAYGPSNAVESTGIWGGVWINTQTVTTAKQANVGYFLRWWVPAVMDRLIALATAILNRYDNVDVSLNAANADCFYKLAVLSESVTPLYTTYTDDAAVAQYARYFKAVRLAAPTMRLRMWGNYMQDNARCKEVLDLAAPYFWDFGGADCINETGTNARAVPFDMAMRGVNPVTKKVDPTYTNYVGKIGYTAEIEPDEQGPRSGGPGPAAIGSNNWVEYYQHANDQGATDTTMFDNGYTGNNDKRFKNFLSSLPPSNQPRHPDAQDFLSSLALGGTTVNGATAGQGLVRKDLYPTGYPT